MISLNTGIVADYPMEWVYNCIDWAGEKNRTAGYGMIGLAGVLAIINNMERRDDFVRRWQKEEHAR
jgi:uncharacterized membrane protein YuzA (DUF378 family)